VPLGIAGKTEEEIVWERLDCGGRRVTGFNGVGAFAFLDEFST
jgi:hypothetical protein